VKWSIALPIAAGLVAALVSAAMSRSDKAQSRPQALRPAAPLDDDTLAKRVERLELNAKKHRLPMREVGGRPALAERIESARERNARPPVLERPPATEYFATKLAEHLDETVDRAWAPSAERSVSIDVAQLVEDSQIPARVGAVRCATTSCSVELEWQSFAEAQRTYETVVHAAYTLNCGRAMVIPEPARPDEPYRGTLLLSCGNLRGPKPN
jgi:hypothetical protein